ncbi:hypothetical protein QTP86_002022 [Hemibagrus guttatus]|nr:hypothetical protein QTP86_002022 [Hemibagrus guttatus]
MEREGDRRPARVVRLRHSVRIQLRPDVAEDVKKRFGWDWVVLRILRDFAGISPGKLLCLQDFTAVGFLDVTFSAFSDCSAFFGKCSCRPEEEVLRGLRFVPLFAMDEVPVTVHIYNPYVADEDIRAFLGRYCASVSAGEKIKGRFGIWNGKRRFLVKLKMDPASPGGLLHPPGSFALCPNRGFLHYPGQPLSCWKCGAAGHTRKACTGRRCRLCGSEEHLAAECSAPKTCSLCGSEEHLFRQCPSCKGTFASLFSGEDIAAGVSETAGRSEVKQGPSGQKPVDLAEHPGDSRQEAHATTEEGAVEQAGAPQEGRPSEAAQGDTATSADLWPASAATTTGEAWTPASWPEILEGQQETPRAVQPDWALMDFSDGLEEEGESEQELDRVGKAGRPKGGQIRAADLTADDRVPKRARPEVVREFEIMAVVEAAPTGVESEERGDYSQVGADNLGQPGGGRGSLLTGRGGMDTGPGQKDQVVGWEG